MYTDNATNPPSYYYERWRSSQELVVGGGPTGVVIWVLDYYANDGNWYQIGWEKCDNGACTTLNYF